MFLYVVIVAELVEDGVVDLQTVLLEPFVQNVLALLLYLAVVASQYGLNLALGLGCAHEVDP